MTLFKKCMLLGLLLVAGFAGYIYLTPAQQVYAAYDGGRIIDNTVFLDANSMNQADIQNFLASKGSALANRTFLMDCPITTMSEQYYRNLGAPCGQNIPAAQIIYYASQIYGINPRVVLTTLQKEQSLITNPYPSDWNINQAMGYGCPTTGVCNSASGFLYQIDNGVWTLRFHMERARGNMSYWFQSTSWVCGTEKEFYKPNLYPNQNVNFYDENGVYYRTHYLANAATSSMYCYTPHAYNNPQGLYGKPAFGSTGLYYSGSYNFVYFYEIWFGTTQATFPYVWQYYGQSAYSDKERTKPYTSTPTTPLGGTVYFQLKARNMGHQPWSNTTMKLGTTREMDVPNRFATPNWPASTRATYLSESVVNPGDVGTFNFEMKMPDTPGTYTQYFNILIEGREWLNDPGMFVRVNVNAPHPPAISSKPQLSSGEALTTNDYLLSQDGLETLSIDNNGSLTLRINGVSFWGIKPGGDAKNKLVMQQDGNLVLYNSLMKPLWNTETQNNPGARLLLQPDGNLVIYSVGNVPLWNSGTVHNPHLTSYSLNAIYNEGKLFPFQEMRTPSGNRRLILQPDGNLVLYDANNKAVWASNTVGKNAKFLAMQTDGNLVLYNTENRPIWNSGTANQGGIFLVLQDDGNFVLYTKNNIPTWATYTNR